MMRKAKIGVADTTFARMDMGGAALATLDRYAQEHGVEIETVHRTVPGFKDLPVACKKLIEEQGCDLVIACGQAGGAEIDKQCAHEASLGLQQAMLMTNTHILEVFVHTDEVAPHEEAKLKWLGENRAAEHALNACWMLFEPERMAKLAGTGQREGFEDEGAITTTYTPEGEDA
ncbi:MAG: riboflavin synthase [Candidatus Thermoplasmatota archaeon]|nr:riboflavin synthase [Candidatus Thermoplasmatota archaeon]